MIIKLYIRIYNVKIILVALLVAATLVFNYHIDFWRFKFNAYAGLLSIIVFSLFFIVINSGKLKVGRVDFAVLSVLLFSAVSRVTHTFSFWDFHLLGSLSLSLYYISLKTFCLDRNSYGLYVNCILIIGWALCLYCLGEFFNFIEINSLYWKIKGNFPNPGPLGGFLAVLIPFGFNNLLKENFKENPLKYLYNSFITLLMFVVVLLSESRAALLAVLISISVMLCIYRRRSFFKYKYIFAGISAFCFALFLYKGMNSVSGRILIWKISLLNFFKKPVFGVGYEFFASQYINFQSEYFSSNKSNDEILLAGSNSQAFNEFLKFMLENGLAGMLLLILLTVWLCRSKKLVDDREFYVHTRLIFFGVFICFAVFAMFSFPLQFLSFKLLILNQIAFQKYCPITSAKSIRLIYKRLFLFAVSPSLLYCAVLQYKAFEAWKKASELQYSDPQTADVLFEYAHKYLNNDGTFLLSYGTYKQETNWRSALVSFQRAKQTDNFPILYLRTAALYEKHGSFSLAENDLLKRHFIEPHLFVPQEMLFNFYLRRNDKLNAHLFAEKILAAPVKIPSKETVLIKQKAFDFLFKP